MFARLFRLRHLIVSLLVLVALVLLGLHKSLFAELPAPDALITCASTGTTKITDRNGPQQVTQKHQEDPRHGAPSIAENPRESGGAFCGFASARFGRSGVGETRTSTR